MRGWDTGTTSLPSSHVFLTAAFGRHQKTIAVPRWAMVLATMLLVVGGLWSLGCTVYVVGHDSLLASAMRRERDLQYDYEDRIAALQRQLEKKLSQQAQLERSVGTRLDMLAAQEGELRRKAGTLATFAEAVLHLSPHAANAAHQAASSESAIRSSATPASAAEHDADSSERTADRIARITRSLSELDTEQQGELTHLQTAVAGQAARYRDALAEAGLTLARFAPRGGEAAGGPFVPLDAASMRSPFERASLTLQATLEQAEKLKTLVARVPFEKPLAGAPEVTSPFGARIDPFLGRPALHTGIDLRDDVGTEVLATAPGRVVSAGLANGYGIMVEVDHGAGLSTRYAHLSAATVTPGQQIGAGEMIGRVGATGRATGPHLHYEVRIDGEPVDPMRFLLAGHHLAQATPL